MKKSASYLRPTNPWASNEKPLAQRCITPDGRGYIWPWTSIEEQVERGRYCVILDDDKTGAKYFDVNDIQIESILT